MKIIGYAAAYPAMELRDFDHWNNTMKMFIDRAGEYMDGLSVHLYDGINIVARVPAVREVIPKLFSTLWKTTRSSAWGKFFLLP